MTLFAIWARKPESKLIATPPTQDPLPGHGRSSGRQFTPLPANCSPMWKECTWDLQPSSRKTRGEIRVGRVPRSLSPTSISTPPGRKLSARGHARPGLLSRRVSDWTPHARTAEIRTHFFRLIVRHFQQWPASRGYRRRGSTRPHCTKCGGFCKRLRPRAWGYPLTASRPIGLPML